MSSQRFETFLARLYSDADFLERFLATPERLARDAGLDAREQKEIAGIDRAGLLMAARSFALKRAGRASPRQSVIRRLWESAWRRVF